MMEVAVVMVGVLVWVLIVVIVVHEVSKGGSGAGMGGITVMGFRFGLFAPVLTFLSHLVLPLPQVTT